MRAAVYYAPAADDPLWLAGCAWLGRDPGEPDVLGHFPTGWNHPAGSNALEHKDKSTTPAPLGAGSALAQPDLAEITEVTSDPRRYGFHATLKPPMRLATSWNAFRTDARALAGVLRPFALPPLAVRDLSGFLALRETVSCAPLQALADICVAALDGHRAPSGPDEVIQRQRHGLSPARNAMLLRWGYPDVFTTWRFHMTLTHRLRPEQASLLRPAAEFHFAAALSLPRQVEAIALFVEPQPGADFTLAERLRLRG